MIVSFCRSYMDLGKYLTGRFIIRAVKPVRAVKQQRNDTCRWDGELTDLISGVKAVCLSVCLCLLLNAVSFQDYIASVIIVCVCVCVRACVRAAEVEWRWQAEVSFGDTICWNSNIDGSLTVKGCPNTVAWSREGLWRQFWWAILPPGNIFSSRTF